MSAYPPTVDAQRELLTRLRETYRQNGFLQDMDAEALLVQNPGTGRDENGKDVIEVHEKKIADHQAAAKNAYAAARRMDEKLARLPKPKEDKKKKA